MEEQKAKIESKSYEIPWQKSLATNAGLIALGVVVFGFSLNIYIGIQSINTLSRLIHDERIDRSMTEHVQQIKKNHQITQTLVKERIHSILSHSKSNRELDDTEWLNILQQATQDLDLEAPASLFNYEASGSIDDFKRVHWLSKHSLKIGSYKASFPNNKNYQKFLKANELRQNYNLIGSSLHDRIRKTLIYTNALGFLTSFLMLLIVFVVFARSLRLHLITILSGFAEWAEKNLSFRFHKKMPGELGLITQQFNAMAQTIDDNRQKTIYLEKIASWQVIARKLAHEIKNPLTPIQMMMSQIYRAYPHGEDKFFHMLDQAHSVISEEVTSLRRMVDHFSNFAKLPTPELQEKNLYEICKHVVDLQSPAFPEHHFGLLSHQEVVPIECDDGLIKQVLINLIKNAAEANYKRKARIDVIISDDESYYTIAVRDDGPGIPPQILKNVFEAYVTTKHTGPTPGMGLGLAICQKIILEHRGEISVHSEPQNTVFSIRLPKKQPTV